MLNEGRVTVRALVVLCLAGIILPVPSAAPVPRGGSDIGSSGRGRSHGLAQARPSRHSSFSDSQPPDGDGDVGEGTRRRDIESLRQLLQGGDETLDQALDREENQREEDDDRERVRTERDKLRRERAGEVAFLRSLAIRDAQGSFATAQSVQVSDVNGADRDPRNASTGDSGESHMGRAAGRDKSAGRGPCDQRPASRWETLMAGEELGTDVGADADDSLPDFDDMGSTISAQANLHAQQAVQRAMQRLEQVRSAPDPRPLQLGVQRTLPLPICNLERPHVLD